MSSKKLPFFKFDADDWLTGKIQLLTMEEQGIFINLLARIWRENGNIENTALLYRQLRVSQDTLRVALITFKELGILQENDGILSVKFITRQLNERTKYIEQQREFGRQSAQNRKGASSKQKGERRKKKADNNGKEDKSSSPKRSAARPKITFGYDGDRRIHGITQSQLDLWKENFPALDVNAELKKASAWLDGHDQNRKKDIKRFLASWLLRSQENAKAIPNDKSERDELGI